MSSNLNVALRSLKGTVDIFYHMFPETFKFEYDQAVTEEVKNVIREAGAAVNSFSVNSERIAEEILEDPAANEVMKAVVPVWIRFWGTEGLEFVDDRNKNAVRRCAELIDNGSIRLLEEQLDDKSELLRVASLIVAESMRMHRTLMQQFTEVIFRLLALYAPETGERFENEYWWDMPLV